MQQKELIDNLIQRVQQSIKDAEAFLQFNDTQLNFKENPEKWSILECLEHLNLYGDFYLVEINDRILAAPEKTGQKAPFKSGFLGHIFTKDMLPKEGEAMKKMTTFKDKDPKSSSLPSTTINRFIKQQKNMLLLLEQSRKVDLNQVKTNITILKGIIRLKLGDTFRFVIFHNQRHIIQAKKINIS